LDHQPNKICLYIRLPQPHNSPEVLAWNAEVDRKKQLQLAKQAFEQSRQQLAQTNQQRGYDYLRDLIAKATDPTRLNQAYNVAGGNLSARQGQAVGGAQATMAAQAASRGLLNPSGAITGAGSRAAQPYADAFGQLEQGRADATRGLDKQAFDLNFLLERAIQGDKQALEELLLRRSQLEMQQNQFNYAKEQNEGSVWQVIPGLTKILTGL